MDHFNNNHISLSIIFEKIILLYKNIIYLFTFHILLNFIRINNYINSLILIFIFYFSMFF